MGGKWDLNPQPSVPQTDALTELSYFLRVMRLTGVEPVAHGLEGRCSIQLSYKRDHLRGEKIRTSGPLLPRQVR